MFRKTEDYKLDLEKNDLVYPELSYVFNSIGGGHKEVIYQNVGRNFFDFFIEEKIVVELKSASRFSKANYDQVLNYLNVSNVKLALLISFGTEEVRCKRVVNFKELNIGLKNTDS